MDNERKDKEVTENSVIVVSSSWKTENGRWGMNFGGCEGFMEDFVYRAENRKYDVGRKIRRTLRRTRGFGGSPARTVYKVFGEAAWHLWLVEVGECSVFVCGLVI